MTTTTIRRLLPRATVVAGLSAGALVLGALPAHAAIAGSGQVAVGAGEVSTILAGIAGSPNYDVKCAFGLFPPTVAAHQVDTLMEVFALREQALYPKVDGPAVIGPDFFPTVVGDDALVLEGVDPGNYRAVAGCAEISRSGMPRLSTAVVLVNEEITVGLTAAGAAAVAAACEPAAEEVSAEQAGETAATEVDTPPADTPGEPESAPVPADINEPEAPVEEAPAEAATEIPAEPTAKTAPEAPAAEAAAEPTTEPTTEPVVEAPAGCSPAPVEGAEAEEVAEAPVTEAAATEAAVAVEPAADAEAAPEPATAAAE